MTSFTEVRLFSTITYGVRNPLHAGYTFTNTEGLVNHLLQDHSIAQWRFLWEGLEGLEPPPKLSLSNPLVYASMIQNFIIPSKVRLYPRSVEIFHHHHRRLRTSRLVYGITIRLAGVKALSHSDCTRTYLRGPTI